MIAALRTHPGASEAQLAGLLNRDRRSVVRSLERLMQCGRVAELGDGDDRVYVLVDRWSEEAAA